MAYAKFSKRGRKRYIQIICDNCGKVNYIDPELFKVGYTVGGDIYCNGCGKRMHVTLDKSVERYIRKVKK